MLYQQSREDSAGLLRLAVQRMGQHPAALTPICYTVWYEYLAGINPHLATSMDARLREGGTLADAAIDELYRRHCSEFSAEMQQHMRDASQHVLVNLRQQADEARLRIGEFGGRLEQSASSLSGQQGVEALHSIISSLQGETAAVASSMRDLGQSLEQSQQAIDDLRRQLDHARAEALVDPLTGTMNRRGFDIRMDESLGHARRQQAPLSLVVLDIDHFKQVNDSYGHLFGDQVIRGLAQILKANVKGRDTVARIGGEEFGLLLPETDVGGARILSEKICHTMALSKIRRVSSNQEIGGITVSVGVASLAQDEDQNGLFDRADRAMYASKGNGRNQVTVAHV
ncbi:diguanylate cyclase VdcA [mine drainage metagenome]|uniref:Diguanylate cyclase VdcA n=1 Tax=mine drainage metagenome TaxID=410659 RepID=A0A1J5QLB8_9ZZZZ